MQDSVEFLRLADNFFDGVVQIDADGLIVLWNKGAERITGYAARHLIGRPYNKPAIHLSEKGEELRDHNAPLLSTIKDGRQRESLLSIRHREGYDIQVLARTTPVKDDTGRIIGGIEIFTDNRPIIAAFQSTQRTEDTMLFDPLTRIGNRAHIESKIRYALGDYQHKMSRFGILFMDIDHFKEFNDTYGHLAGDKILRIAAQSLRHNLRLTDSCGRWGGEEFIALVLDVDAEGLQKVSEKIRTVIAQTKVPEDSTELSITVSIGSTLARPADTLQTLIERADRLMYKSKQGGRNRVTIGD